MSLKSCAAKKRSRPTDLSKSRLPSTNWPNCKCCSSTMTVFDCFVDRRDFELIQMDTDSQYLGFSNGETNDETYEQKKAGAECVLPQMLGAARWHPHRAD